MHSNDRLYYMDNLRALAMFAGVVFHAAIAYSPLLHPFFPTADRAQSPIVDVFAWFLHLFRMPLFFVVAGFFTALLIEKRGVGGMFANRAKRIALPLVLFWPLLFAVTSWLTVQAALNAQHPSPVLALIKPYLLMDNPPATPPTTMHLWFLYYLLIFYVLCWCARLLIPETLSQRLRALPVSFLLLGLPLMMIPALASVSAPHPAPESVLPQFWAIAVFGIFFALGYGLYGNAAWQQGLRAHTLKLAVVSVLGYIIFLWLLQTQQPDPQSPVASWSLATLEAFLSVWLTVLMLEAGRRFLSRENAVLRYLSDASYTVYLLHLPVLFAIQYQLMDRDESWLHKFGMSLSATMVICLVSYQLLVRHTPLSRLLQSAKA